MVFPSTGLTSASVGFYERKLQSSMAASCQRRHSWCFRALATFSISRSVTPSPTPNLFPFYTFIKLLYKANPILIIIYAQSCCSEANENFHQENINCNSCSKMNLIVKKITLRSEKMSVKRQKNLLSRSKIINVVRTWRNKKRLSYFRLYSLYNFWLN